MYVTPMRLRDHQIVKLINLPSTKICAYFKILFPASNDAKGIQDTEYAYKRRNILEAFVDAAAQHVMQEFNMDASQALEMNAEDLGGEFIQTFNMEDIELGTDGPKTIKLDPSKFKVKKGKKPPKHDEV